MAQYTLTYDSRVDGWTSFYSYRPDHMLGMNNKFFSFRGGNLFVHHSPTAGRNNFYGVQYPSKVSIMMNDVPSDIKVMQAISLEGNAAWQTQVTSYISSLEDFSRSAINLAEYIKKEGKWYGYVRRNELATDKTSKSTYGIGTVQSVTPNLLQYTMTTPLPVSVTVGDSIMTLNEVVVAVINNIISPTQFTVAAIPTTPIPAGTFILGGKNSRIEGAEMRGYTSRVDLEVNSSEKRELFAVNAEIFKSFPS